MPKYKKLIPGPPYTFPPFLTKGFEEGVGYFKNTAKHNPVFFCVGFIYAFATAGIIYKTYNFYSQDPDKAYQYKSKYTDSFKLERVENVSFGHGLNLTLALAAYIDAESEVAVYRKEDLANPDKEFYN